jgi:hypothetical protein
MCAESVEEVWSRGYKANKTEKDLEEIYAKSASDRRKVASVSHSIPNQHEKQEPVTECKAVRTNFSFPIETESSTSDTFIHVLHSFGGHVQLHKLWIYKICAYVMHTFTPFLWTSLDEKFENIAQSTHNGVVDWNTGYEFLCIQDKTLICKKAIFSTSYFRAL